MKLRVFAQAIAIATGLSSCRDSTTLQDGAVNVKIEGQEVHVYNLSDWAVAYATFDAAILPLINWAKCVDPAPQCQRLPARASVLIPFSQIFGGKGSGQVAVFAWRVVQKSGGGFDAIDVRVIGPK